jgi:anti-sigma-K factor RskA
MNGHPAREEDFDLYALGALEGDEKRAIESHVAGCAGCARKLAEARRRIAMLALSAPQVAPSPAAKEQLLQRIHAAAKEHGPARSFAEPKRAGGSSGLRWIAVLVPATVMLAAAAILLWTENTRLDRQLAELRTSIQEQQKQLDESRKVEHLYEAKDTITIALAQRPGMPKGDVTVMYNAKMGMVMCDGWIEQAPADKNYQLWIVPMDGKPVSAGVFKAETYKSGHWMMKVPEGIAPKMFAITIEPMGGVPQPTGPMVLAGGPTT